MFMLRGSDRVRDSSAGLRAWFLLQAALIAWLILVACSSSEPGTAPPVRGGGASAYGVAVVFDAGGLEDGRLNQMVWAGIERVAKQPGITTDYRVVLDPQEYGSQLETLSRGDYDVIVAVGPVAVSAREVARARPQQQFMLVGEGGTLPNTLSLTFDLSQPAFLSGYLAAGVSANGVVCTLGDSRDEASREIMHAFSAGIEHYNLERGADVTVLGWDSAAGEGAFTGSRAPAAVLSLASDLFDAGCEVLLPAVSQDVRPLAELAQRRDRALIGRDMDGYLLAPQWGTVWLTSLQRRGDQVVFDALQTLRNSPTLVSAQQVGTLANGGAGLAPLHEWETRTPATLRADLENLKQALLAGRVQVPPRPWQ